MQTTLADPNSLPRALRLVDTREGGTTSVVSRDVARKLVNETELDLLCVSPEADPPVYKLLDYGKFQYEKQKNEREAAKKQRQNARTLKEFQFTPGISDHDYNTKLNQIRKHLPKHDIQISVRNNRKTRMSLPRNTSFASLARNDDFVLNRVISDLGEAIQPAKVKGSDTLISSTLRVR